MTAYKAFEKLRVTVVSNKRSNSFAMIHNYVHSCVSTSALVYIYTPLMGDIGVQLMAQIDEVTRNVV